MIRSQMDCVSVCVGWSAGLVVREAHGRDVLCAHDSTVRPPGDSAAFAALAGMRVRAAPGTFDPDTVTLMDFTVRSAGSSGSCTSGPPVAVALIEITVVSAESAPPDVAGDPRG